MWDPLLLLLPPSRGYFEAHRNHKIKPGRAEHSHPLFPHSQPHPSHRSLTPPSMPLLWPFWVQMLLSLRPVPNFLPPLTEGANSAVGCLALREPPNGWSIKWVYYFPMVGVTNSQTTHIYLMILEVRGPRWVSLGSRGESFSFPFPAPRGCPRFTAHGFCLHLQIPKVASSFIYLFLCSGHATRLAGF